MREALRGGVALPTILNAANEVAVARFLRGEIGFLAIAEIVERAMERVSNSRLATLDDVLDVDGAARRFASELQPAGAGL